MSSHREQTLLEFFDWLLECHVSTPIKQHSEVAKKIKAVRTCLKKDHAHD